MTAVGLLVAGLGVVLLVAGVKDLDPRTMVLDVVQGNPTATGGGAAQATVSPIDKTGKLDPQGNR